MGGEGVVDMGGGVVGSDGGVEKENDSRLLGVGGNVPFGGGGLLLGGL